MKAGVCSGWSHDNYNQEAESYEHTLSLLSLVLFSLGPKTVLTILKEGLENPLNPIQKLLHTHDQSLVSKVSLDPAKLAISIDHNSIDGY